MPVLENNAPLSHEVLDLIEKGYNREEIEAKLVANGYDLMFVKKMVNELTLEKNRKKRVQAKSFIVFGCFIVVFCFLLANSFIFSSHYLNLALYGIASLGALLALAGILLFLSK